MRKIIGLLAALVVCMNLAAPAFAVENGFVPSITYKPNPDIVEVEGEDGEEYIGVIYNASGQSVEYVGHGCLLTTPVADVWNEEIEVSKVIEDLLKSIHEQLSDGSMKIPYEKHEAGLDPDNMVIRDLFDARWVCEDHRAMVEEEGVAFKLTFDLGVVSDAQIYTMVYDEATGEWSPVVETVNNGDGTVTCTFEKLGVVAFSTPGAATPDDAQSANAFPWIIVLILAAAGVIFFFILLGKKKKEEEEEEAAV